MIIAFGGAKAGCGLEDGTVSNSHSRPRVIIPGASSILLKYTPKVKEDELRLKSTLKFKR